MKTWKKVQAIVLDDDGESHELTAYYVPGDNPFEAVEQEAECRCIRYATTETVWFPEGEVE